MSTSWFLWNGIFNRIWPLLQHFSYDEVHEIAKKYTCNVIVPSTYFVTANAMAGFF